MEPETEAEVPAPALISVVPGDRLAIAEEFDAGRGTYLKGGTIYASLVGDAVIRDIDPKSASGKKTIEVVVDGTGAELVPKPGATVTARITRVQQLNASCTILCLGMQALSQEFKGIIRQQDVRQTEIDKVIMYECFRPGDIVKGEVLSLGDARSYYITTAKNELGVVYAKSPEGAAMVPVGWEAMQCPVTRQIEKRKVAAVPTSTTS